MVSLFWRRSMPSSRPARSARRARAWHGLHGRCGRGTRERRDTCNICRKVHHHPLCERRMLNLLPWQRKAFRPLSGLFDAPGPKNRRRFLVVCAAHALAFALSAAIFSLAPAPARADVVIQSNGKTTRLHDDGSFSSGFEPAPEATPGADRSISTPPRKNIEDDAAPETLPYGIVPEVHIPWYPGVNRDRPVTGPQVPDQGQRPPPPGQPDSGSLNPGQPPASPPGPPPPPPSSWQNQRPQPPSPPGPGGTPPAWRNQRPPQPSLFNLQHSDKIRSGS